MKNFSRRYLCAVTAAALFFISCSKKNDNSNPTPTPTPTPTTIDTSTLKGSAAGMFFGMAITYNTMNTNAAYASTVKGQANQVTFGNEMKYASIVQNDGSLNFTTADALYTLCNNAGLQVFGHNLCWHTQQNTNYLNTLITGTTTSNVNLALNGSFESGISTNWFTQVSSTAPTAATITLDNTTAQDGTNSMKVVVTTPGPNSYSIQAVNDAFAGAAAAGQTYKVSFWAKGAGSVILVLQGTQYEGATTFTTTAAWAQYSTTVTLPANETAPQVRFNFATAGTYNIDNITVNSTTPVALTQAQKAANIDAAFNNYITGMATHYKGKVKAWDVVNEIMNDGASGLRTSSNTNSGLAAAGTGGVFYWTDYLGRNTALKAFNYAHAADPNALLFINDYNLEYNSVKLDSLIALVKEIQNKGGHIDGIGTQMHISVNTSTSGIDAMFVKLAATGLKIRISELDIAINTSKASGFVASSTQLAQQATLYHYVVASYKANIPKAQQYGITVWGVADTDSWINTTSSPDAPLLFDGSYAKKAAFTSVVQALKGQ
ncbi:MAG: endo-1,4-beta-xylanase [Mucilaginibacter sp.]